MVLLGVIVVAIGAVRGFLSSDWSLLWTGGAAFVVGLAIWAQPFVSLASRAANLEDRVRSETFPEVGRDISWPRVVGHIFRVMDFDRAGTTITDGKVRAASRFTPYGYLHVESPLFGPLVRMPIVHSGDFGLASLVFDTPQMAGAVPGPDLELLITYRPERPLPGALAGPTHPLHFVFTPRGTLERYYEVEAHATEPSPEKVFPKFVYLGDVEVMINMEPAV